VAYDPSAVSPATSFWHVTLGTAAVIGGLLCVGLTDASGAEEPSASLQSLPQAQRDLSTRGDALTKAKRALRDAEERAQRAEQDRQRAEQGLERARAQVEQTKSALENAKAEEAQAQRGYDDARAVIERIYDARDAGAPPQ
jgi:chromosome segregation ATPase